MKKGNIIHKALSYLHLGSAGNLIIGGFICLALSAFRLDSLKTEFLDITYKEAAKLSKAQKRPLFVFVATEHCDICQRTKRSFNDAGVADYYNTRFVSIKMDPDKLSNNMRANSWGVFQTPTYVFLNAKKQVIFKASGYRTPAGLLGIADSVMKITAVAPCK